jgi:ankyrin repeat protein
MKKMNILLVLGFMAIASIQAKDWFVETPFGVPYEDEVLANVELAKAVWSGSVAEVQKLLAQNPDLDREYVAELAPVSGRFITAKQAPLVYLAAYRDKKGTFLGLKADKTPFEIVKVLVQAGFPFDTRETQSGDTPLMAATEKGHKDIVVYLLEQGADSTKKNYKEETALMIAQKFGHKDIVKLLENYSKKR